MKMSNKKSKALAWACAAMRAHVGALALFCGVWGAGAHAAAPTVQITSPAPGATYGSVPSSVILSSNAVDSDGSIARVEYYSGSILIGQSAVAPFGYAWTTPPSGHYTITAKAVDSSGESTVSAPVSFRVGGNALLGGNYQTIKQVAPGLVKVSPSAAGDFGVIVRTEYYSGQTLLGVTVGSTHSFTWNDVPAGTYAMSMVATNQMGGVTSSWMSSQVKILSEPPPNNSPNVYLQEQQPTEIYQAPAAVELTAIAGDADGFIDKVEFYNGTTLIAIAYAGEPLSESSAFSLYKQVWGNVAQGSYTITAKAYDSMGEARVSQPVQFTVGPSATPVASLYFVHPDHLGSPRMITDAAKKVVWRWDNLEAFGSTGLQEDPDQDTKKFKFNLRFAGQYHDLESGLHYNRHRDYDPLTGRYVQADPIGLSGGISLYSYVSGNPLSFIDPLGLAKCDSTRRTQTQGDVTVPSERAARREAMRQHGGSTSQANNYKRIENPDKNVNLRGPRNEKAEFLEFENSKGETVKVDHHKWGHEFKDNGTFEKSHYHGPKGNHISYD